MRIRYVPAFLLAFLASTQLARAQDPPPPREDSEIVLEGVTLRAGVTTDMHLQVFVNEARPCNGRTVLAVPGFAHTAATFAPLAEAMFSSGSPGQYPCRVVALDFPAHGSSPAPAALPFGFLLLDDYVSVLLASLEALPEEGIRLDSVLAHSQGGLVVQMAQQRLLDGGSSLQASHGIRDVVLFAPVQPAAVPWGFADSGAALSILGGFLSTSPALGPHFSIPDAVWGPVFFSDLGGTPTAHTPAASDVTANAYNAPEPFLAALQLVGALHLAGFPPTPRPGVSGGIFGPTSGTSLHVVTFAEDQIIRPAEGAQLYAYLTGDTSGKAFVEVGGGNAVHDMYVADPTVLLQALGGTVRIR